MGTFDYDFELLTDTDFKLVLTIYTQARIMNYVFNQSRDKLKKKGVNVKGAPETINEFEVPEQYFKPLKVACRKLLKTVAGITEKDKIIILNHYDVVKVVYKKVLNKWHCIITIRGLYKDER
jgi:6-pyruvoyl-tetrahydropterin synthase